MTVRNSYCRIVLRIIESGGDYNMFADDGTLVATVTGPDRELVIRHGPALTDEVILGTVKARGFIAELGLTRRPPPTDEVGLFWVVTTPTELSDLDSILFRTDVLELHRILKGWLESDRRVVGLFTEETRAAAMAGDLLDERDRFMGHRFPVASGGKGGRGADCQDETSVHEGL